MQQKIHLIECPRDAMQGWTTFIPTERKIKYLNALLKVGFHTLDCVSFVSPKAIPQMADSEQVMEGIDFSGSNTKLLAIVANERGAHSAAAYEPIHYLGYPFSISETFQQLNTNSTIEQSWNRVMAIQEICTKKQKELVVYISMGFGNPYGDAFNEEVINEWIGKLSTEGIRIVSLADTVGLASPEQVKRITGSAIQAFPQLEIGVHLHSTKAGTIEKLEAAYSAGCYRFDGTVGGLGGCPMANNPLVGNMNSEAMISFFDHLQIPVHINQSALSDASSMASEIFL